MTNQLTTPAADILAMIDRHPRLADSTKRQYGKAIAAYLDAGHSLTDPDALARFAAGLSQSRRAFLKAAVKLWTDHIGKQAKAGADPESVNAVTATLYRLDAINEAIQIKTPQGEKSHTWLSQAEVKRLFQSCDQSPLGRRDRVVLALLVGAGLRRAEAAELTFDRIGYQPVGERFRTVLDVTGKGARDRVIPLSDPMAAALDRWATRVGGAGRIARSVDKGGNIGDSLSDVGSSSWCASGGAGRPARAGRPRSQADLRPDRL